MRNLTIPQDIINKLGVNQIIDITDDLPVNKNYTWSQLAGQRDLNDLTTIAWHHDAIKKEYREGKDDFTVAKGIAQNHIDLKSNEPKGDAGIPYHFWIRGGQIYQCNDVLDRTYGVASNNGYTVHVCVHGEYASSDVLTDSDRLAIEAITLTLMCELPNFQAIKGHGEINPTSCPGYDYSSVRNEVMTLHMKLQQEDSWFGKLQKVADLKNQIAYMSELIKKGENDGNAQWAMSELMDVIAAMDARKLL